MASNVTSSSSADRSILVTDIPYDTDDSGKQKKTLEKYFGKKKIGGGDVQRVICPLGGSMTKALIVFEYERVMDTIFNYTHQLGEEEIQVARLPLIFTKVRGTLDDFYFSILPRSRFRELVKQLGKIIGADNLQATKSKVTELTGTTDDLKAAADCLLEAVGITGVRNESDSAYITERCLDIDNIPYMTDDVVQIKDELGVYFKQNGGEVQSVICPTMGKSTRAIVIFKSVQDRNRVSKRLQHAELFFYDNTLDVQHLPKVFSEVTAKVDNFYLKNIPKIRMNELCASMIEQFGTSFTKDGKIVSGSLEQICNAGILTMHAIGLRGEDKASIAMTENQELKQTSSGKHRVTGGVSEEKGAKQNHHEHIRDEPVQDVSTTVSAQTDESKQSTSTQHHPGTAKTGASSGDRSDEAGSELSQNKHRLGDPLQGVSVTEQASVSRRYSQNHPGTAGTRSFSGRSDETGSEPSPNKHMRDDPGTDVSTAASAQAGASRKQVHQVDVPRQSLQTHPGTAKPRASDGGRSDEVGSEPSPNKHMHDAPGTDVSATASTQAGASRKTSKTHPGAVSGGRSGETGSEPSQNKHGHDNPTQDVTANAQVESTHKHRSASRPMHNTQDVNRSEGGDANQFQPVEDYFGKSRCAANFSNDSKSMPEPLTAQREVPDTQQGIDDEASSNRDSFVTGAPALETAFKDCFLTVDKMKYQYWKTNYKTDFQTIEKTYNVKIKLSSHDSKDENKQLVELQAKSSKGAKAKQKDEHVQMAKEEFVRLYSDIDSATHKESVPFNITDDKKIDKIQDRIKKSFPRVILAWNETGCILCGENATVEKAAEVMNDVMSEYETFTVDKITYRYLSTVNKGKLDNIRKKFHVTIKLQQDTAQDNSQQAVHIKPNKNLTKKYSAEDLRKAKDVFISLYQDTFFSIKRIPVKCQDISTKAMNDATDQTTTTYPNVMIMTGDNPNEVIICAEEKALDDVVRAFRSSAGLVSNRRLKKSISNDMEQPDPSDQHEAQSSSSDRHHQIPSSSRVDSLSPSSVFVTPEGLQIIIVTGDITKQDVDVIVNAANKYMDLNNGGVAKAISTAAGPKLQKECKDILRRKQLTIGDCIDTNAFQLHCKRVVHAVGPTYTRGYTRHFSSDLAKTFSNLLLKSDVLCARSISIPLISSGNYGGPKQTCAEVLVKALQDFSRNAKDRYLHQVNLVNIDKETTSILQKVCEGIFQPKHHPTNADPVRENTQAKGKAKSAIQGTSYQTSNGLEIFVDSGDITQTRVEVIVNAANNRLKHGRGVAGAISKAAGAELQEESNRIMKNRQPLRPEECVMTDGYKLKCRILHIVGPVYKDCNSDKEFFQYLKATFLSALRHVNLPVEAKDVAIPLVSSGIYGGPKQICAEALLDAIEEFNKEHTLVVKRIYLINLDDDATEALQEVFNQRYSQRFPISSSTQTATESASESKPTPGIDVQVIQGDITMQNVDVIVNPTDENMKNHVGAAKAISAAAGARYKDRCRLIMKTRYYKSLVTGEVLETAGYGLKCNHVLNTASPYFAASLGKQKYYDTLLNIFLTCLRMANSLGQSIAIPLIGTGNLGAPKELCAHALMKAIETFDESINPKGLKKVVIISIDKEAVLAAQMMIDELSSKYSKREEDTTSDAPANKPSSDVSPTGRFQTEEGIVLINSRGNIAKQQADVMISCTDENLKHKDGVCVSISKAAGPELQREYKDSIKSRKSSLKPSEKNTTGGYKLPCKNALHVIEPKGDGIETTTLEILLHAGRTLSAKSVALPLIGSASESSSVGKCAQKTAIAVKRFSRMKTSVREIHFINVGFNETSELHKALSATFKSDNTESYYPHENTNHPQSGASYTDTYQGNANGTGSLTKGLDSNDPSTTSQTGRHNTIQLDQGAVPKGPQQHQTTLNTIQDTASTATNFISGMFNQVVGAFSPASDSTATTSDEPVIAQYPATHPVNSSTLSSTQPSVISRVTSTGTSVAQPSVTPQGATSFGTKSASYSDTRHVTRTGLVTAQQSSFTLHVASTGPDVKQPSVTPNVNATPGSGAALSPVNPHAITKLYASAVNSNTSRSPDVNDQSFTSPTGCSKCWAQLKCKLLEGCGHRFCTDCIAKDITPNAKCLTCSSLYCVTHEKTLHGTMTYFIRADVNLPGQSERGAIVIMYEFRDGLDGKGRRYKGYSFAAYLPNNPEGYETVCLLRHAFVAGLIFVVLKRDDGQLQVTWSHKIPHKTEISAYYGYPDSDYLNRVKTALKKCGIVSSITSTEGRFH